MMHSQQNVKKKNRLQVLVNFDQELKHTVILPVGWTSCKYYAYPHLSVCCGGVNV